MIESNVLYYLFQTIRHQKFWGFIIFCVFFGGSALLIFSIPKTYKSTSLVSLSGDFATIPGISEFVSRSFDIGEIRAQKDSFLMSQRNDEFFLSIKDYYYKGVKSPPDEPVLLLENLRRSIEVIPLSRSSYRISGFGYEPSGAQMVLTSYLEKVKQAVRDYRIDRMTVVRDAVKQHLELLKGQGMVPINFRSEKNATMVRKLSALITEKKSMEKLLSKSHPQIAALDRSIAVLRSKLDASSSDLAENLSSHSNSEEMGTVYLRAAERLQHLEIALAVEKRGAIPFFTVSELPSLPHRPIAPRKKILLMSAALGSVIASLVGMLLLEMIRVIRAADTLVVRKKPVVPPKASLAAYE